MIPACYERTDPPEPTYYECPVCGEEITGGDKLYFDENGDCVGCDGCIATMYAEDYFEGEQ